MKTLTRDEFYRCEPGTIFSVCAGDEPPHGLWRKEENLLDDRQQPYDFHVRPLLPSTFFTAEPVLLTDPERWGEAGPVEESFVVYEPEDLRELVEMLGAKWPTGHHQSV